MNRDQIAAEIFIRDIVDHVDDLKIYSSFGPERFTAFAEWAFAAADGFVAVAKTKESPELTKTSCL